MYDERAYAEKSTNRIHDGAMLQNHQHFVHIFRRFTRLATKTDNEKTKKRKVSCADKAKMYKLDILLECTRTVAILGREENWTQLDRAHG